MTITRCKMGKREIKKLLAEEKQHLMEKSGKAAAKSRPGKRRRSPRKTGKGQTRQEKMETNFFWRRTQRLKNGQLEAFFSLFCQALAG